MHLYKEESKPWVPELTPAELPDAHLIRMAQRNPGAFVHLYDRYVAAVYRYCACRLPVTAAEDATSITFLNAFKAIDRFDPEKVGFRAWLFTIAHNAVVDQLRSRLHLPIDELQLPEPGPTMEDRVIRAEHRRRLSQALLTLPADQQHVIHLRLAGLPTSEIGEVMGKSPGAVRVIHHRAVKRLRRIMECDESAASDRTEMA